MAPGAAAPAVLGPQILPGGHIGEELVITQRLAILGLILLPEMPAARLLPVERVQAHQLPQLQEVRHPAGLLQRLIQLRVAAGDVYVAPELRPELGDPLERLPKTDLVAGHAAVVPHDLAQLAVERVHRALAR